MFSFRVIYLHTHDNCLYKTRVLSLFFFVIKWTHGKYLDLRDVITFIMYLTNNKYNTNSFTKKSKVYCISCLLSYSGNLKGIIVFLLQFINVLTY